MAFFRCLSLCICGFNLMARFVFRLEGALRHRKHVEQERQRDLAVIETEMARLQNELRNLDESVRRATEDMRQNRLMGVIDLNFLAAHRRFTIATQRKAMSLMQKMSLVQRQIDEARKRLSDAARDRMAIEKLREKHLQRWREEMNRSENNMLDEIGNQMAYNQIEQTR
jgi:flagellar protein FliJ